MNALIRIALCALLPGFVFSQTDFDQFQTLQSSGKIPEDFSKQTADKLVEDTEEREGLSKSEEAQFLEMIHYGIGEILHSGICVYGDPVSLYVERVADKLLADIPEVRKKLRFYTLKSNVANAFSTDQGIVFVTTGLIAQLTDEAQLAFVLAHEVSHYTEKHVVQTFDWNLRNYRNSDHIEQLSVYSKEKEFSADEIAVGLCHKAGYSSEAIFTTFDVLMYSYLPFDEVEFPKTYFNNDYFYAPEFLFPDKKFEIKAEEDYNDEFSSHPNIKKRKEAVGAIIDGFSDWSDQSFIVDRAAFMEVRNIARFESVRTDIIDGSYPDALYSIFLLEREFPKSTYLNRMKAHAWYGLNLFKENNRISDAVDRTSDLEGEIAALHYFIKKQSKVGLATLALRQVYEVHKTYPDQEDITLIYEKLLETIASNSRFDRDKFKAQTFSQAADAFIIRQDSILRSKNDSTTVVAKEEKLTKYERIKSKKTKDDPNFFDSTEYYLYGLTDILADSDFNTRFEKYVKKKEELDEEEERLSKLSYRERAEISEENRLNESKLGIKEVIVVEPTVLTFTNHGLDRARSEELEVLLSDAIDYAAENVQTNIYHIDKRTLYKEGTDAFNFRSTLMAFLNQVVLEDAETVVPLDYEQLKAIQNFYGSPKVMFTLVEHYQRPYVSVGGTIGMIFAFPALPLYIMRQIFTANDMQTTFIVLDLEKGTADYANTFYFKSPVKNWYLRSQTYNILHEIRQTPQ